MNEALDLKVEAKVHTTVMRNGSTQCYEAGEEMCLNPGLAGQCADRIVLDGGKQCEPRVWFVTVPAGGNYSAEVESGSSLCMEFKGCLAYSQGTDTVPMVIPEALDEIKENAPELIVDGATKSLNCVTEFALINCSSEPIKVQLTFKGC